MKISKTFRFADFELDMAAYVLRRRGQPTRLERRPMDLLILLVERGPELVSRQEIIDRLWSPDVVVEVETGINTAIRKVRQVLGDNPDAPKFVETVPGRGYRFIADVAAVVQSAGGTDQITLAVLPFENIGGRPEQEYLADGFTEEATTAIGQIDPERLSVIGRTSVMSYKRTMRPLSEIGRELGATYLVEGSIRAENRQWRVTARLVRAADQVLAWSASFDSEPSSILEFQRQLSTAIAEQIRVRLSPGRLNALERRQSRVPAAYDLYLRGRSLWNQLTPATNRAAVEHYAHATALDPHYSLAWAGLADAFAGSPINADAAPLEVAARAREAAAQAVGSGDDIAESHTSKGIVNYWIDWDCAAAEGSYRRAIDLDPHYALAHRMLGVLLGSIGRHEEAAISMKRARELDALQPMNWALSAHVALLARDEGAGREFARRATVIGPSFWVGYFQLAWAYERLGEPDLALQALAQAEATSGGNSKTLSLRGYILSTSGHADQAEQVLQALESISQERYMPPYALALVHAGLGRFDRALDWLRHAYDVRDVHLIWLPMDPKWDPLRKESAFQKMIERCGFAASPAQP